MTRLLQASVALLEASRVGTIAMVDHVNAIMTPENKQMSTALVVNMQAFAVALDNPISTNMGMGLMQQGREMEAPFGGTHRTVVLTIPGKVCVSITS